MKIKITLIAGIVCMIHSFSTFSQWINCPNTNSLQGRSLGIKDADIYTGVQNGQVFKSTNDGGSFSQNVNLGGGAGDINEIFVSGNNIFANRYRSSDNGGSWELKNAGLSWTEPAPFNVSNITQIGSTLYIGTSNGVYHSTDDGDNWSEIAGNNWSTINANNYVGVLKSNNGILYASVSHGAVGGLYLSGDNGVTWTATGHNGVVRDIAFSGTDVFLLDEYEIYRSVDNCATFTDAPYGGRKMLATDGKILIVGDALFGIYDIATGTRVLENDGITSSTVFSVVIKGDNVFIGTLNKGVFKRALSELGITSSASVEEKELVNVELFPNPVQNAFSINMDDYEGATADIYDVNGTLVHSFNLTSGQTQVDVSFINSGAYFVQLKAKTGSITKKLIINK